MTNWRVMKYYGLAGLGFLLLFTTSETITEVPTYPTIALLALLGLMTSDYWWLALSKSGKAFICNLDIAKGGHACIHYEDIRSAIRYDEEGKRVKSYSVIAVGGFVVSIFANRGSEAFIICPPEYIEDTPSGVICHARLRPIPLRKVEDYIMAELVQLEGFDPVVVEEKNNLYFGSLSNIDSSTTTKNLAGESEDLDKTEYINYLKDVIEQQYSIQMKNEAQRRNFFTRQPIDEEE